MPTRRARTLIVLAVCGAVAGLLRGQPLLSLTSMSVLIWLSLLWISFRIRAEFVLRGLTCRRTINGSAETNGLFWTSRIVSVAVTISAPDSRAAGFCRIEDIVPENLDCTDDSNSVDVYLTANESTEFTWQAIPRGAGTVGFPGVSIYSTDLQGLFYVRRFVATSQSFRVLPTSLDEFTSLPAVKQVNALPPPGIHRLQRAGMGSELLEIREYVHGDPPKSIAWKVSARRGVLMTRQYESEVPVRTTLFVDGSYGAQIGEFGRRPVDQIIPYAASISRSAMAVRDPVGLVLFNDRSSRRLRYGTGDRHFRRILDDLADCGTPEFCPPTRLTADLLQLAWSVAKERRPELFDPSVNSTPVMLFLPFGTRRRRLVRIRTQLATFLTEHYSLGPDSPVRLGIDDVMLASLLQKFLLECGFPWSYPVIDRRHRELHDWDGKFDTLTEALTRSVRNGHDNELFVLLVDLIDYSGPLGRLADAIRVARSRHHRVAVVCPWPAGSPVTPPMMTSPAAGPDLESILKHAEHLRLNSAATRLKRELRRLGASVVFAPEGRAIELVMAEAELARSGRTAAVRRR